jgi:hypothetical protein
MLLVSSTHRTPVRCGKVRWCGRCYVRFRLSGPGSGTPPPALPYFRQPRTPRTLRGRRPTTHLRWRRVVKRPQTDSRGRRETRGPCGVGLPPSLSPPGDAAGSSLGGLSRLAATAKGRLNRRAGSSCSPSLPTGNGPKLSASVGDLSGSGRAPLPPAGDIGAGNYDPRDPCSVPCEASTPPTCSLGGKRNGRRETRRARTGSPAFRVPFTAPPRTGPES